MSQYIKFKLIRVVALCAGCLIVPGLAFAGCPVLDGANMINDYSGTIAGKYKIGMALVFNGALVNGVYFYDKDLEDIKLKGRLTGDRQLELDVRGTSGNVIETFTGTFPEHFAGYGNGSQLECREVMVGQWQRKNDGERLPFELTLQDSMGGALNHRYAGVGVEDDHKFEASIQAFQRAVRDDNKKKVASFITYPLRLTQGETLIIKNQKQFIAHYDEIITPGKKVEILTAIPHDMSYSDYGVALGAGIVWFDPNGLGGATVFSME